MTVEQLRARLDTFPPQVPVSIVVDHQHCDVTEAILVPLSDDGPAHVCLEAPW